MPTKRKPKPPTDDVEFTPSPALQEAMDSADALKERFNSAVEVLGQASGQDVETAVKETTRAQMIHQARVFDPPETAERMQDATTDDLLTHSVEEGGAGWRDSLSDEEVKATADALFSGVDGPVPRVLAPLLVASRRLQVVSPERSPVAKGDTGIYTDLEGIGHLATVDEVLTTGGDMRVNLSVPTLVPPRVSGVVIGEGPDRWSAA